MDDVDLASANILFTSLFHSLAKQEPEDSDQRDRMISIAIQELDGLQHNLKQMMTDQPSEQPVERH